MIFSKIIFVGAFACFLVNLSSAQDIQALLGDGPFSTSIEAESLFAGKIKENSFSGGHQFEKKGNHRLGLSGRYFELKNDLKNIPHFYNLSIGGNYKYYLEGDRTIGFSGSFGSSSDKLFKDSRDSNITANLIYRKSEKWILVGNYSNNRPFLNNIPLPGFVYIHHQSREKLILFGLPFAFIQMPIGEGRFSVRYLGFFPYNHRLRLLYNNFSQFKPFASLEQGPLVFFDSSRENTRERTFWFERRASIGIEKSYGPFLKVDLQVGQAFDREYYQARSISRKHSNVQKINDATYFLVNLKSSF